VRGEPLDKATVYRQVKATFARAGINVPRSGGRTLRNTFAVKGFSEGTPASEMVERLGLALERSTQPYARRTLDPAVRAAGRRCESQVRLRRIPGARAGSRAASKKASLRRLAHVIAIPLADYQAAVSVYLPLVEPVPPP
jgi:hypothetical protein